MQQALCAASGFVHVVPLQIQSMLSAAVSFGHKCALSQAGWGKLICLGQWLLRIAKTGMHLVPEVHCKSDVHFVAKMHCVAVQKGRRLVRKDTTCLQVLIGQTSFKQALQQSASFKQPLED